MMQRTDEIPGEAIDVDMEVPKRSSSSADEDEDEEKSALALETNLSQERVPFSLSREGGERRRDSQKFPLGLFPPHGQSVHTLSSQL